ncbi:MAG: hypothetical protein CSA11_04505 [Chloroflexi bacterium]|nr:MAG: hypothetical protein CSA11_04505 [Chloroflexota bacterium]
MLKPWLTQYDSGVPKTLNYPVLPLDHLLIHTAHKMPKETAVLFASADGRLTAAKSSYRDLNMSVYQFAAGLQQMGIVKGDRVAVMLPNCPQFIIAINAVWRIGAIAVCAESRFATHHLENIIVDSGSKTVITTEKVKQRLEKNWHLLPLERAIVTVIEEYLPWQTKRMTLGTSPLTNLLRPTEESIVHIPFDKVFHKEISKLKLVEVSGVDSAVIFYERFRGKKLAGVQLNHRNLVSNATAANVWCQTGDSKNRRLAVVPFPNAFGLTAALNMGLISGDTLVVLHNLIRPEQVLQAIKQFQIDILPATPAMLTHLAGRVQTHPELIASLKQIISSGPLSSEASMVLSTFPHIEVLETFGQAETSAIVAMRPRTRQKPHAIGLPLPDTNIMIADADLGTDEMPSGERGEIIVKGPQVMQSYWHRPGSASECLRIGPDGQHGWYFTGCFGYMDEEGFLYLT